jgi:predicted TPR repeat methyltransferase
LQGAGLTDVRTQAVILRDEGGKPVDGWLFSARGPQSR